MFTNWIVAAAAAIIAIPGAADTRLRVPTGAFRDTAARGALDRLEHNTDEFKDGLDNALDHSVLNGSPLEDRLNQWANLLEDEIDTAQGEFHKAADSGDHPDLKAMERFADHWGNAMMAATAINRAMIRRGFAPGPERQWIDIRRDLNVVAGTLGRPPLPDMTVVIFRPAPAGVLSHEEVKRVMKDLRDTSHRFEDRVDDAWFLAMGPEQRDVLRHWADELKSATRELLDEYDDRDAAKFQFRLEETLMLAAGLNRALLANRTSAAPAIEWERLRSELNTLAGRFGYPALAGSPRG